jgi:methylthioribose-1-phosphate isomerase
MSKLDDNLSPLQYKAGVLSLLDQRALPNDEIWLDYDDFEDVADAIQTMVVRGAPAIGCTAAYGVAIGARQGAPLDQVFAALAATRPTAVNLFWALDRMRQIGPDPEALEHAAIAIHLEDIAACRAIGANGAALLPPGVVLTHCNAGALATGGYGTALGVIRSAVASGTKLEVFADETRPFLQGARLTAWELAKSRIPVTVLCDNMAGHFMSRGAIQSVVVGADRIAANGDFANKIGTFTVALLAREHGIPFFVAAPLSSIDRAIPDGSRIPIEERPAREVTHVGDTRLAPEAAQVRNPAFDVTPARLVSAIITEAGVARPPFGGSLAGLFCARVSP